MIEQVAKSAAVLADPKSGWVNRKDAATFLGQVAGDALTALQANHQVVDPDVRQVVTTVLADAAAGLNGFKAHREYSMEELASGCEKPGERQIKSNEDGFIVEVQLKSGRHHRVFVARFHRNDGAVLYRVLTFCGKATPDALHWALQSNMGLVHGAFGLSGDGEQERLCLVRSFLAAEATPQLINASVTEFANYGDWIEQKLTGIDAF